MKNDFAIVSLGQILKDKLHRLSARYWLNQPKCVSCNRVIDGEEVEFGVKADDGTEDMCRNCFEKQLEKC